MNFDITWTITAVIAVSSFLSPIAVAVINNKQQARLRKLELEYDEHLQKLNLEQQTIEKQFDIYYQDKKDAFSSFLNAAGFFSVGKQSARDYEQLQSTIQTAMLFCSLDTLANLTEFLKYVDAITGGGYSQAERKDYSQKLTHITEQLNAELALTKLVTDSESHK